MVEKFLQQINLQDSDDIDSLLEFASLLRQIISQNLYSDINHIINYTVKNNYSEAFSWAMAIIQEEIEKDESILSDFNCSIGSHILNYDEFVQNMQVDFNSVKNYIEKIYNKDGEVEAFFNVMIYSTCYENVFFISSENFDNKDNDYIQYKLSFVRDKNLYYN